jgi:hypothetical protein
MKLSSKDYRVVRDADYMCRVIYELSKDELPFCTGRNGDVTTNGVDFRNLAVVLASERYNAIIAGECKMHLDYALCKIKPLFDLQMKVIRSTFLFLLQLNMYILFRNGRGED